MIAAATLLGLVLRGYQLSRSGHLLGVTEYDDGADFGSALRLVNGAIPYRDFVTVQPPGITLLMLPAALLSKLTGTAGAMAAARILTAAAGGAGVLLGGLLVRHRGLLAVIVTCGILAVYPGSVQSAHTVLLEPWLVLGCLAGAVAVFDGDQLTGGRLAGLGRRGARLRGRDQGVGDHPGGRHPGAEPAQAPAGGPVRRWRGGRIPHSGAAFRAGRAPRAL